MNDRYIILTTVLAVHNAQPGWRRIIAQAVLWGIPTPAFSTALAFFDGYRSEILPANLLQAQVIQFLRANIWKITHDLSAITSVPTPSEFFPARRMTNLNPERTSVSDLVTLAEYYGMSIS